jgi:glyoxylase-like metal-dependent hydrolase (beta-lactamase superfamily II)
VNLIGQSVDRPPVERYETSSGIQIFRLPLEVFPGYFAYGHVVCKGDLSILIDVGSGFGRSHEDLLAGFDKIRKDYDIPIDLSSVDDIVITHGHIDHFGGTGLVRQIAPNARIGIHELARPVLTNYDERLILTSQKLSAFLKRSGIPEDRMQQLLDMHMIGKHSFKSVQVDFVLNDDDTYWDCCRVIHVPGHEPGLIMLLFDDILLTSDHVLPKTSVALAPESIMPYTGVGHYLDSLEKASKVRGVRIALGGHEEMMPDYYEVVERVRYQTNHKIDRVLDLCAEPRTVHDLALEVYGRLDGYSALLKLEQTGARVEYLNQRGLLTVSNLDELQSDGGVIRYVKVKP